MIAQRDTVWRVLAAGLLAAQTSAPLAAQDDGGARFVAPDQPMKLTRVLTRELGNGEAVKVARSWRIRFERTATGYTVTGEQIAVEVEAPPALSALADIERRRPPDGVFPLKLDAEGRIVEFRTGALAPIRGMTEAARDHVEGRSAPQRAEAMRYVATVQQAGAGMAGQWPRELFFPAGPPQHEARVLPLSGNETGRLTVTFEGTLDGDGQHLEHARREIATRIGDSERTSRETWRLEPLE